MKVSEVAESCLTLNDPMDRSLPGSSVHGIFQARVLEWDAIAFSEIHDKVYLMTTLKTSRLCHVAKFTPPPKKTKEMTEVTGDYWASMVAQAVKICLQYRTPGFHLRIEKMPWRREWQPTLVFLPGKSHGQKSLAGYSPRGCKELNMTE